MSATMAAPAGEYRGRLLVDHHGVGLGLADKMCWEITGPVSGLVWVNTYREANAIRHFLGNLFARDARRETVREILEIA